MRFGLNTFLVSSGFTDADLPLIQIFKSYGAAVIELAIVEPTLVSAPLLADALAASELTQPIICGAFCPGRDLRGRLVQPGLGQEFGAADLRGCEWSADAALGRAVRGWHHG